MTILEAATRPDLALMERWTGWMFELLQGAADAAGTADGGHLRATLAGAAEDANALRLVLEASITGEHDEELAEALRSIYALWDENQERYERLAAKADPEAHRQWAARSATTRLLCEGIGATAR